MAGRRRFKERAQGAFGNQNKAAARPEGKKRMKAFTFEERRLLCDLLNYGISGTAMDFLNAPVAGMKNKTLFVIQDRLEERLEQGGVDPEKRHAVEAIRQKVLDVLNKRYLDGLGKNAIVLDGRPWGPKKT